MPAVEEARLVTPTPISPVPSRSTKMEETPGNRGNPALPAAADPPLYYHILQTSEVRSLAVCLCAFRGKLGLFQFRHEIVVAQIHSHSEKHEHSGSTEEEASN